MRLKPEQLTGHLQRSLAPVYLISGDEPLQVDESCAAIRAAAHAQGYTEREVLTAGKDFDWNTLWQAAHSLSLFTTRRLIELRLPTGKPGDAGSGALVEYASRLPADTLLLVISAKLDAQTQKGKWFGALEQAGVVIQIWPVEVKALPGWIGRRLNARGMQASPEACGLLAERAEGNLLAATQDIEKLYLLYGAGKLDLEQASAAVADSARFDIYDLVDAAANGDVARASRIVNGLREEGVEPVLVLWALARELRSLAGMAYESEHGARAEQIYTKYKIWEKRKPIVHRALQRHKTRSWHGLLQRAARTDRVIKGFASGDAWDELSALSLAMAGAPHILQVELQ